jgi:hypothetical protein
LTDKETKAYSGLDRLDDGGLSSAKEFDAPVEIEPVI